MVAKKTAAKAEKQAWKESDKEQISTYRDMLNMSTDSELDMMDRNRSNRMVVDAPPEHKDRTLAEGDRFTIFLQEAVLNHLIPGFYQGRRPLLIMYLRNRHNYGKDQGGWDEDDPGADMDDGDIYDIKVEALWDSNAMHQYSQGNSWFAASTYEQRNTIRSLIEHALYMFDQVMERRRLESLYLETSIKLTSQAEGHTALHGGYGIHPKSRRSSVL